LVFRPLLKFSREDLQSYAKENKLQWREDTTNQDLKYQRNAIRIKLLPLISELRTGSLQQISKFFDSLSQRNQQRALQFSDSSEYLSLLKALRSGSGLEISNLSFHVLKNLVDKCLNTSGKRGAGKSSAPRVTRAHWEGVQRLLEVRQSQKNGELKTVQFPGGMSLVFKKNRVFWQPSANILQKPA
jgi:tRNA(Ile)-lysidine synthase TilS/MesJ